mmetsp:Transcript_23911/g.51637  ORF Transcript_23911/g.51637 Transcript_23911/m.51637 type:complete len:93 (+) Transcript_23911:1523-1801(+)
MIRYNSNSDTWNDCSFYLKQKLHTDLPNLGSPMSKLEHHDVIMVSEETGREPDLWIEKTLRDAQLSSHGTRTQPWMIAEMPFAINWHFGQQE